MRIFIAVLFLLLALPVFSAEPATDEEPPALVKAREKYNRDIAPITKAYLATLEGLKKQLGAKGDLKGAQAVQTEIDGLPTADSGNKKQLVGTWQWGGPGSDTAVISADGTARCSTNTGKWTLVRDGVYRIVWVNGIIDTLSAISKDTFSLESNRGVRITVQRK